MASGKTHDKITYSTGIIVYFILFLILKDIKLALILTISYIFSGLMFSGDLDIESRQQNRWLFLKFIWKPYQYIFKHRSFFTHGVIIATIIRIIYLFLWFSIFFFLFKLIIFLNINNLKIDFDLFFKTFKLDYSEIISIIKNFLITHKKESIIVFIGLCLGSLSHSLADIVYSNVKATIKKIFKIK